MDKNYCQQIRSFFLSNWHVFLTCGVVLVAVYIFYRSTTSEAAEFGDFIAGVSSALAFLWLIIGMRSQANDLSLQRQELVLQRSALEQQARELRTSSRMASLAQIQSLVDRANVQIRGSELGIKKASELGTIWFVGIKKWKGMFESTDASVVQADYMEWLKIEGVVRGYLANISAALKLYMEYHLEVSFDPKLPNEEFLFINSGWMRNAPFLAEHEGTSALVANYVFLYGPGLQALQAAGMFASAILAGKNLFKDGALKKMRDDLESKGISLPKVVENLKL